MKYWYWENEILFDIKSERIINGFIPKQQHLSGVETSRTPVTA